jgi:hypothetical protein
MTMHPTNNGMTPRFAGLGAGARSNARAPYLTPTGLRAGLGVD